MSENEHDGKGEVMGESRDSAGEMMAGREVLREASRLGAGLAAALEQKIREDCCIANGHDGRHEAGGRAGGRSGVIVRSARAEAERRWPSPNTSFYEGLIEGFVWGALWGSVEVFVTTIEEYVERVVAEAPPMTDEQKARLASLLAEVNRG